MKEMSQLNAALNAIRSRFFAFEEFPRVDRSRFPAGVCEAAMKIEQGNLASYSTSRKGKELEAMILGFPELKTTDEWERIGTILITRFSPRIVKLIFQAYQEYYDSDAIQFLVSKLITEANRKGFYPESGRFFWDFGQNEDSLAELKGSFQVSEDLNHIFITYRIGEDTPLAAEIRRRCLEDTVMPVIIKNARQLINLIEKAPEASLHQAITNYIQQFDVLNPADEVNQAILNRFGEPSGSRSWDGFPEEGKKKFTQWCFCHLLKLQSERFPKKYEVLSQYYERVRQCLALDEVSALVIEFEKIVVVDLTNRPYSCFYHIEDFEREMKKWTEFDILPTFIEIDKVPVSARDYIIEEKDDTCILLCYEGIDLLYIQELLDIKFGLVPEFRRMKLN